MKMKKISVQSTRRNEMIDITRKVMQAVKDMQISEGKVTLYVPHTTAAVTINENADPDVKHDIILALDRFLPKLKEFRHMEGNSDSHIKSSLIGCNQDFYMFNGKAVLGTWQGFFFCEFDGPRLRQLYIMAE